MNNTSCFGALVGIWVLGGHFFPVNSQKMTTSDSAELIMNLPSATKMTTVSSVFMVCCICCLAITSLYGMYRLVTIDDSPEMKEYIAQCIEQKFDDTEDMYLYDRLHHTTGEEQKVYLKIIGDRCDELAKHRVSSKYMFITVIPLFTILLVVGVCCGAQQTSQIPRRS
jgi:hypothetical protein